MCACYMARNVNLGRIQPCNACQSLYFWIIQTIQVEGKLVCTTWILGYLIWLWVCEVSHADSFRYHTAILLSSTTVLPVFHCGLFRSSCCLNVSTHSYLTTHMKEKLIYSIWLSFKLPISGLSLICRQKFLKC